MKTTHLAPALKHSAGTQPLSPRWPTWGGVLNRLALFLCLVALLAGAALVAHAAASSHALAASHTCHATQVTLHGTKAPTIGCLDGRQKGTARTLPVGGSGPLVSLAGQTWTCDDDALFLYDASGNYLCINGSGGLNLPDVGWNDRAVAFWTGCYDDTFTTDINFGGDWATAPGSPDGSSTPYQTFPYKSSPGEYVYRDTASFVEQWAPSHGGDDCIG